MFHMEMFSVLYLVKVFNIVFPFEQEKAHHVEIHIDLTYDPGQQVIRQFVQFCHSRHQPSVSYQEGCRMSWLKSCRSSKNNFSHYGQSYHASWLIL